MKIFFGMLLFVFYLFYNGISHASKYQIPESVAKEAIRTLSLEKYGDSNRSMLVIIYSMLDEHINFANQILNDPLISKKYKISIFYDDFDTTNPPSVSILCSGGSIRDLFERKVTPVRCADAYEKLKKLSSWFSREVVEKYLNGQDPVLPAVLFDNGVLLDNSEGSLFLIMENLKSEVNKE